MPGRQRRDRKKVEIPLAHLKRILRLGRLYLRGPSGAQFELTLATIAAEATRYGFSCPSHVRRARCVSGAFTL